MRKKIFSSLIITAVTGILVTALLLIILYELFLSRMAAGGGQGPAGGEVFLEMLPLMVAIVAGLICLSILPARYLTARIIAPIERYAGNLESKEDTQEYVELSPLIDMIKEQHQDLIKNARIRQEQNIPAEAFYHYDTPCTIENQIRFLKEAGFAQVDLVQRVENTTIVMAKKRKG